MQKDIYSDIYNIETMKQNANNHNDTQKSHKPKKPKKPRNLTFRVFQILFYLCFAVSVSVASIIAYYGYQLYKELSPQVQSMINYHPNEVTQVFDVKGRHVANLFEDEYRFYVNYDEIPGRVIEALLAVEDTMFFEHEGVNLDAIVRAMFKNLVNMRFVEGGSTLTQQLVKNMLLTSDKTLDRKVKEFLLSIRAEQVLTKEQILERYLNYVFLGHGYYGIKAAALGYFNKSLKELSIKEAAMLVGIPKSPVKYDPTKNLRFSLNRANAILKRMYDLGWISQSDYQSSVKEVPKIYNQTLTQNKAPYVVDEALRELDSIKDIKSGGYKIYLTMDLDYQQMADSALFKGYENIAYRILERSGMKKDQITDEVLQNYGDGDPTLNGAMVVTNPHTGEVLAMVGGVDYTKSSFNRVTQTNRQFGSTIKPFVYQLAFNKGYSPAEMVVDSPKRFGKWVPNNDTKKYLGPIMMQTALEKSLNIPTIDTAVKIGEQSVYQGLKNFGFNNFPEDLTVVIGSLSISPMKAAMQYSLFSNYGVIVQPYVVAKIITPQGEEKYYQTTQSTITTPEQSFLVTSILRNVVSKGTGYRARVSGIEIAGKTGTSNLSRDAWFCGFTPDLQVVVWYGRDDNTPIGTGLYGGNIVAPVFADFIKKALDFNPGMQRSFRKPEGVYSTNIRGQTVYYTDKSKINYEQLEETNRLEEVDSQVF